MTDLDHISLTDAVELAESRTGLSLTGELARRGDADWEGFRRALTWHLQELLDHRIAQLPQLLYRVDVAESKVDALFAERRADTLAEGLADLIIERLVQKLITRQKWSGQL